ncbi:MAG: ADOP family duplicated permease, partial [Terriglobia bacterium]
REAEIVEEVAQHLEDRYQELVAGGATENEARRLALEELSDEDLLARGLRRVEQEVPQEPLVPGKEGRSNFLASIWQDIRCGLRMLRKNPGFTAVAVITLALGIGANTAIFSVVNGVLLRPLPYKNPGRLVQLWATNTKWKASRMILSPADFFDLADENQVFEEASIYRPGDMNLAGRGEPERVWSARVSTNMFKLLGVRPALGRAFLPDEAQPGKGQVAIISHGLWERRFGGDGAILGKPVTLDTSPYVVVGVMPLGFAFPRATTDVWVPFVPTTDELRSHGLQEAFAVARLKRTVRLEQAQADMNPIAARLANAYPKTNEGRGFRLVPLQEEIVGDVRPALLVLFGAVGLVLLIACANVANLSLARGAGRQREIAIREALGASRPRVIRQLLTESLLVALIGGGLGLLFAPGGIVLLRTIGPADFPRLNGVGIDRWVLWFTFGVSVVSSILFGLVPAFQVSKPDLRGSLKEAAMTSHLGFTTFGRHRTRSILVISQVALALVLLAGSGLLIRSFWRLVTVDPGFDVHNVLTMSVSLPSTKYSTTPARNAFFQDVLNRVAALPGVTAAGAVNMSPISGGAVTYSFEIEGHPSARAEESPEAELEIISPGYFQAMGVKLLRGRGFTNQDRRGAPVVAIISQALARRYWPNEDPVGRRILGEWSARGLTEIVGVVSDTRDIALAAAPRPQLYLPYLQFDNFGYMTLAVRASSNPLEIAHPIEAQVWAVDRDQPVADVMTLEGVLSKSVAEPRFRTLVLGIFAGLALSLALVGVYGVMSYTVIQRTHEIGIRMALGAERGNVLRLVVRQGFALTFMGLGAGILVALALTRFLVAFLYDVRATDSATFVAVSFVLAAAGLVASYIPARRATKVDPMEALRYE